MTRAAVATVLALAAGAAVAGESDPALLPGWAAEDHAAALAAAEGPCGCDARALLERRYVAGEPVPAFVTGYFEPEIAAARAPRPGWVPLHGLPGDPRALRLTRAEIAAGALEGRARALYWLADPVDAFFLHVQGSGRLRLPDGTTVRVGYAGRNDHPYRSIGRVLVEREGLDPAEMTAHRLAAWLRADPARGRALMNENPSYIFFREAEGLPAGSGPIGAAGVPLTPLRSAAVDPEHHAPDGLFWLETTLPDGAPFRRLVVAQDTGAAIRGPGRVDLFFGSGPEAGRAAGRMRARGRLTPLRPRAGGAQ